MPAKTTAVEQTNRLYCTACLNSREMLMPNMNTIRVPATAVALQNSNRIVAVNRREGVCASEWMKPGTVSAVPQKELKTTRCTEPSLCCTGNRSSC